MQNLKEFTCLNGGTFGEGAGMVNAIQAAKSLYTCPLHSHVNLYLVLTGGWQKIRKKSSLKFIIWHPDWFLIVFLIPWCNETLQGRKLSQINLMTVRDTLETFGLFLLEHHWFAHCSITDVVVKPEITVQLVCCESYLRLFHWECLQIHIWVSDQISKQVLSSTSCLYLVCSNTVYWRLKVTNCGLAK